MCGIQREADFFFNTNFNVHEILRKKYLSHSIRTVPKVTASSPSPSESRPNFTLNKPSEACWYKVMRKQVDLRSH